MDIDWSEAPEGATHFRGESYEPRWYNFNAKKYWSKSGQKWCNSDAIRLGQVSAAEMITRPTKPAEPEWDGEGLPLVGTTQETVELFGLGLKNPDYEIVAHHYNGVTAVVCVYLEDGVRYMPAKAVHFRPIRTKEQQEREALRKALDAIVYADSPDNEKMMIEKAKKLLDSLELKP